MDDLKSLRKADPLGKTRFIRFLLYRIWVFQVFFCLFAIFVAIGQATDGIYVLFGLAFLMGLVCTLLTKLQNRDGGGLLYVLASLVCGFAPMFILPGAVLTAGAFFLGLAFVAFSLSYYKRHFILDIHGVAGQFVLYFMFMLLSIMYLFEPIRVVIHISNMTMLVTYAIYVYIDNVTSSADFVSEANKLDFTKHLRNSSVKYAIYMLIFAIISLPFIFINIENPLEFRSDLYLLQRETAPQSALEIFRQMLDSGVLIWCAVGLGVFAVVFLVMKRIVRTKPKT
jgi:hypothetical protein